MLEVIPHLRDYYALIILSNQIRILEKWQTFPNQNAKDAYYVQHNSGSGRYRRLFKGLIRLTIVTDDIVTPDECVMVGVSCPSAECVITILCCLRRYRLEIRVPLSI